MNISLRKLGPFRSRTVFWGLPVSHLSKYCCTFEMSGNIIPKDRVEHHIRPEYSVTTRWELQISLFSTYTVMEPNFSRLHPCARARITTFLKLLSVKYSKTRFCFIVAWQPQLGQYLLIVEVLRYHSGPPHSVVFLWTSDQTVVGKSTWQQTTLTGGKYPCFPAGFEPTMPESERLQTQGLDRAATGDRQK